MHEPQPWPKQEITIFAIKPVHNEFKDATFTAQRWQVHGSGLPALENHPGAVTKRT